MKFRSIVACVAICVPVVAADAPGGGVVEEIIAKVNGDIITRSELDRSRRQMMAEAKQRGMPAPEMEKLLAERDKDALRERIDQLLLVQRGKELSINVDPEVTKYVADLQLRSNIAEPEKFQQYVREQTGQPYEDYKNEIKNGMLTQRVIRQEVGGRINIPRADLQKYYDEHKADFMRQETVFLREILVSTEGKDAAGIAAAEKKAEDLSARAKKGEKFAELARLNSDTVTKQEGGELPPFKRGELNKQIEDTVFAADRGFVTEPIRIPNGFLILKVEDKYKPGQATFEEVENEITEKLYMGKFQPQIRDFLTKLRNDAFLEIKAGYVDTGAAEGKNTAWSDPAQLKPDTVTKEEVQNRPRRRRLLWTVPLPGTQVKPKSSSK